MKKYRKSYQEIESLDKPFVACSSTRIWEEEPSRDNPYLAGKCRCHGYDHMDLMEKRGFADVLFLLLRGELPNPEQSALLEALMVGLINPGPRHAATRAAMNAGVGKTDPAHILPIGLSVLGGAHLGGTEVSEAMAFMRKQRRKDPKTLALDLLAEYEPQEAGDWRVAPGFGSRYGGIDPLSARLVDHLIGMVKQSDVLEWGAQFAEVLATKKGGWLMPSVAAAVFLELGFHPREGAGLFQIAAAPGLLAHGLELANQPVTALPFIDDEHYFLEE